MHISPLRRVGQGKEEKERTKGFPLRKEDTTLQGKIGGYKRVREDRG